MRPGSTPMVPPVWNAGRGEGSFAFAFTSMVNRGRACMHGILGLEVNNEAVVRHPSAWSVEGL